MDWGRNARGELEWRSFDPPEFDSRKLQELSRALQEASKKMSYSFEPPSIESSSADEKIFHIYSDTFENIEEVVEYIKNTKINGNIFDAHNPSSNDPKSSGFNDFFDFEEALNALEYGTSRYFNSFNYKLKKVNDCIKKYSITKKTSYKNDVVGFVPIVPNFIIGHPVNMINQEQKEKIKPTATIIFEKAMAAQYNSDDMISFASIIFSLEDLFDF